MLDDVVTNESGNEVSAESPAQSASASTLSVPDRSALEAKVSKGLESLSGDSTETDAPAPEETPNDEGVPDQSGANESVTPEPDEGGTDDSQDAENKAQNQPPKPKTSTPTVPAAYRRSLKAYEWTDEEIDEAAKAHPASFLATAQKIHANRNAELTAWADAGRRARQTSTSGPQPAQAPAANPHINPATNTFRGLDVDAMVEKYGNEDLVREIASPVNAIIQQINGILPDLLSGVASIHQSKQQALSKQVDQFFSGPELATYNEIYGKDSAAMTPEQIQSRNKVLEMADALIAGAAQQGRTLTVTEAMTLAHDSVSGTFTKQAIRKQIQSDVKKRNNGLTLRAAQSVPGKTAGAPKSAGELENRTRSRLAAVFNGN